MLSPEQIAIVKATVPLLESGGEALTTHFYRIMLGEYPQVRPLFNQAHQASGDQPRALANGVLTLSGERTTEKPVGRKEGEVRTRVERGTGRFHRQFILPDSIDSDQIQARGRNGVVEISIAKKAKAQPRRITVAA